jgi:hypothetical protein
MMAKAVTKKESTEVAQFDQYREDVADFDRGDLVVPRLLLAQSMSPFVKEKKAEEGDLLNSITGAILGDGSSPVLAVIVAFTKEYILWRDRDNGGGVFARAFPVKQGGTTRYKWDKPNQTFVDQLKDARGKVTPVEYQTKEYIDEDGLGDWIDDAPPAATLHYNYVVCLPDHDWEMIGLSLSKSQVKKARQWNTMIQQRQQKKIPVWGTIFSIKSTPEQSGDNIYANFDIGIESPIPNDPELMSKLHELYKFTSSRGLAVDEEDRPEEDD